MIAERIALIDWLCISSLTLWQLCNFLGQERLTSTLKDRRNFGEIDALALSIRRPISVCGSQLNDKVYGPATCGAIIGDFVKDCAVTW